jgi:signal transduction histidine kinase
VEILSMKQVTLQTGLYVRVLTLLVGLGLLFGFSLNYYLRVLLETEIADKTHLIFSNLLAMQTYVRDTLRPTMYEILPEDGFVMEAMSTSYVTRKVMSDFNPSRDKFTYRRVALDPRNLEFGANPMERAFIEHFQANPGLQSSSRYFTSGGEEYFVMARPVVYEERCLACHGKPAEAPKVLLAHYGDTRGFGRFEGEIGGLDSIIMPVEQERAAISRGILGFVVVFAFGTMVILGVNHLFFERMTVVNIGRLASLMRQRFPAEAVQTLDNPPRRSGGEIEGMIEDMERFADHLRDAKEKLRDYAANLETMVADRTAEATREARARSSDVRLFLTMLELFVKGNDHSALLDQALAAVAERFGASSASFCCFYSMQARNWPCADGCPALTPSERERILTGEAVFDPEAAIAPVHAAGTVRGALTLRFPAGADLSPRGREVFVAVGHQLGIALENLEAMENLLRQKAVLESIFEGIADPLFLLSATGDVVHANESALELLAELKGIPGSLGVDALGLCALAAEAASAKDAPIQREAVLPGSRSLTLRAYPLEGLGGQGRAIVYARDNTMEKTMMAKLQQSEKSMALGLLSAGLAHEINNPLGVILCYARLLWDDGKSPNAPDLDIIIRYTLQAQKVLSDLMRFARPKPEELGAVDLPPVVEFIARVFRGKAAKSSVTIETFLAPDLAPVRANASALEQMLTNLMLNSLDAIEEHGAQDGQDGVVRLEAKPGGPGEALLIVRDNGPGFPAETASRLFDPFYTTKSVGKGTGLGLSVVYGLARDLGGHIEAASAGGAVFTIHLPTAQEDVHDA